MVRKLHLDKITGDAIMFDLIVVGNTTEASEAAVAAGRLGARVALIHPCLSGWAAPGGAADWLRRLRDAISSCTLPVFPDSPRRRSSSGLPSPAVLAEEVIERDLCAHRVIQQRLDRWRVQCSEGQVCFQMDGELSVRTAGRELRLRSNRVILATGTRTDMPEWARAKGPHVLSVDEIPALGEIPRSLLVVGGGTTGLEAAFLFSLLGTRVTLIDRHPRLALGPAIPATTILRHLQRLGVRVLLDSEVTTASENPEGSVSVELLSGDRLSAERLLVTTERLGQTEGMGLEELGVRRDERGRLWCNEQLQTWSPGVVGLGDVVGHPRELAEKPTAPRDLVWSLLGKSAVLPTRGIVHSAPVPVAAGKPD
ncbi:MAG: FAD-dependent oxidoreductase [Planctomycetaceae bacterium]|jgi:NAD(P) transhydrogenase